jgi:hypothetical protein
MIRTSTPVKIEYLPVNSCFELEAKTEHRQTCIVFGEEKNMLNATKPIRSFLVLT